MHTSSLPHHNSRSLVFPFFPALPSPLEATSPTRDNSMIVWSRHPHCVFENSGAAWTWREWETGYCISFFDRWFSLVRQLDLPHFLDHPDSVLIDCQYSPHHAICCCFNVKVTVEIMILKWLNFRNMLN